MCRVEENSSVDKNCKGNINKQNKLKAKVTNDSQYRSCEERDTEHVNASISTLNVPLSENI